jgi:hypothetical protein
VTGNARRVKESDAAGEIETGATDDARRRSRG